MSKYSFQITVRLKSDTSTVVDAAAVAVNRQVCQFDEWRTATATAAVDSFK